MPWRYPRGMSRTRAPLRLAATAVLAVLGVPGCYESRLALPDGGFAPSAGVTLPCSGGGTGVGRDCGWHVDSVRVCVPGAPVVVACGTGCGLGACTGDAMIRLCRGATDCTSGTALGQNDDACGSLCPRAEMTCPAEGRYTVLTTSYSVGSSYTCSIATRP